MSLRLLTTTEVAEALRMDERFVRDEYGRGRLRGSKLGGRLRFTEVDVASYVAANSNVQPSSTPRRRRRGGVRA